jgi:hypothetical protein
MPMHLVRTRVLEHSVIPIGWVAVGDPAHIMPPDQHDAIWKIQEPLNFPKFLYGVERPAKGQTNMPEITAARSKARADHQQDRPMSDPGRKVGRSRKR